jgi:hypothetical protein
MSKEKKSKNSEQKNNESNEKYEKILDSLIEKIGGKEYCLRQLIFEGDYREFTSEYRTNNRNHIFNLISLLYESVPFDEKNIINIDISNTFWNKYIMKLHFYDQENFRFFEYSIKNDKVEEISLFEIKNDDEEVDNKIYAKSFYSKIKGGNIHWDKYNKLLEAKKMEEYAEKIQKEKDFFMEKMKNFKFINSNDIGDIELIEAPEQYKDGKMRYLYNKIFYYQLVGIDGYITFNEGKDITMDPAFARQFYEKIVKKLRNE